jgi:uncharacterized membrane protein
VLSPFSRALVKALSWPELGVNLVAIAVLVAFCFALGVFVKTAFGRLVYDKLETRILKIAPGYTFIKETISQFLGRNKSAYSKVALVKLFGDDVLATGFITDEHRDGTFTVYVPFGLNATSGIVVHVKKDRVFPVGVTVEEAMRAAIACGAGSAKILERLGSDAPKP